MVGANYMGGKRNTARAKSKDIVGRTHRRHFGKQRLTSALCARPESCVYPSTLPSILPEIALAHARGEARTNFGSISRNDANRDQPCSLTSPGGMTQHNRPSRVLGALDISDHISMRAAVDRILQQPNLIGMSTLKLGEAAYIGRMQTPGAVKRPTDAHFQSVVQLSKVLPNRNAHGLDLQDLDVQHSKVVQKRVFDLQVSRPQIPRPTPSLSETSHESTESNVPDSPSGRDYLGLQGGSDDSGLFRIDETERPSTSLDEVYLLPRSSPFLSSSQSSHDSILDLDTSPLAVTGPVQSDDLSEGVDSANASSLCSVREPMFHNSSRSIPVYESPGGEEAWSTDIHLNADELKTEHSAASSSAGSTFRSSFLFETGCDPMPILTIWEDTGDDLSRDAPIDFLSDPHPWETISNILKLHPPEPSTVQSAKISFTRNREGVGYVSLERARTCDVRFSDSTFFGTRNDDDGTADLCMFDAEAKVSIPDGRVATDASRCANNSSGSLLDTGALGTVHALQEDALVPMVHCENSHARSSDPLPTAGERDVDMTFDGPCLFVDSDTEGDEF